MIAVQVTYTVKADRVAENEELVRGVYAALDELGDPDIHYATFRQGDGQTFVHLAFFPSEEAQGRFGSTAAFQAFQAGIAERCDVPPDPRPLTGIGAYEFRFPI